MIAHRQINTNDDGRVARVKFLRRKLDLFCVRRNLCGRCELIRGRRLQSLDLKRLRFFRLQIDDADRVIVCVSDVKLVVRDCQTAGFIERRLRPIRLAGSSGAGKSAH